MSERYRPLPLTASITGIDGAGKSTVSEIVTSQLPSDLRIAKISRPVYSVTEGNKDLRYVGLMGVVDKLHARADARRSKRLSLAANALDVVVQGRVIEPRLSRRVNANLVLGTRDYIIDPSVYAVYYSRLLARRPVEQRLAFFQKLTGSKLRDVVFLLTVPPDEAVARIERRMAEEASGESNSSRQKWKHMHEREDHLERLQAEYYTAIATLSKAAQPEVHVIDTSKNNKAQVADKITSVLESRLSCR